MKQSQEKWVIERLKTTGEVSRNGALQNYISRLGAIIYNLNQKGYNISGEWRKTENGRDFVYYLISEPTIQAPRIEMREGVPIAVL